MNIEKIFEAVFNRAETGVLFIIGIVITFISLSFLIYNVTYIAMTPRNPEPVTLERYASENRLKLAEFKNTPATITVVFIKNSTEESFFKTSYNFD